ncbi:MAG: TIGR03016 family PEP-CTERM system-associated outer membrane protein [Gammaproteobacteria bacterium]|nr:TIGR03016 family PEP-CTERM system-associated outer membrane protein [Gammaproteobacteria bacterium]
MSINLLFIDNLQAKDVDFSSFLTVGAGYSDNINLDSTNEISTAYINVNPGIALSKEGSRVKSQLSYNVKGLFYNDESQVNDAQHYLNANVASELVKKSIFVDLYASISQQLLDDSGYISPGGVAGSNDLTETYTYGFAPSWRKEWNNFATSLLKYNYNQVNYSGNNSDDSTANNITLNVENSKTNSEYFWNFDYAHTDTAYDKNEDTYSDAYKLRLGYHYSRKLSFTASSGYEDYAGDQYDGDTGWRAGFIWTPSQRTKLEYEAGQRFFGTTYFLDLNHRSRRLTWHLKYDDSVTDSRNQIINNNDDLQEAPDGVIPPLTDFTAQYYLNRRLTGDVTYRFKKSTITLGFFNEWRYFQGSDQKDEDDSGINLNWSQNMSRSISMNTSMSWGRLEDTQNNNAQDHSTFRWSINKSLSRAASADLMVSYNNNDSDIKLNGYTENSISFNFRKSF